MRRFCFVIMIVAVGMPFVSAVDWQMNGSFARPGSLSVNGTGVVGFQLRNEEALDNPVYPANCSSVTAEVRNGGESFDLSYIQGTEGFYGGSLTVRGDTNVSLYGSGAGCGSFLDGDIVRTVSYGGFGNLSVELLNDSSDTMFLEGKSYDIWSQVFYNGSFIDSTEVVWRLYDYTGASIASGEMNVSERGPYTESDNVFIGNMSIPPRYDGFYTLAVTASASDVSFENATGGSSMIIRPDKRLNGSISFEDPGKRCDEYVSVCENGAIVRVLFTETSNNASNASVSVIGDDAILAEGNMTEESGGWEFEFTIPESFSYDSYGEELTVAVNASNNDTAFSGNKTLSVRPFAIDMDVDSKTAPQGTKLSFQAYPERPFSGRGIDREEVSQLLITVVDPEGSAVLDTGLSGKVLDRFASATSNGFAYPFRVPWNAIAGNYSVNITAVHQYGQEQSAQTWFEVVEGGGSGDCSLADKFTCVYTEEVVQTIEADDASEIKLDIESVAPSSRSVSYQTNGEVSEIIGEGSITLRPNERSEVAIPVDRKEGSYEGNIEVAGGAFVPVEITVTTAPPNISVSTMMDEREYASGDTALVDVVIENTGSSRVSDLVIRIPTVNMVESVTDDGSNVTLRPGGSITRSVEVPTGGLSPGSYTGDDALRVTVSGSGSSVTTNMSLEIVEPIDERASSLRSEVKELSSDTDDSVMVRTIQDKIDEAKQLWESGSYSVARERLSEVEEDIDSLEQEIQREQADKSTNQTGENEGSSQRQSSGGIPYMTVLLVVLLMGIIGGVVWLSMVPE